MTRLARDSSSFLLHVFALNRFDILSGKMYTLVDVNFKTFFFFLKADYLIQNS